VLTVVVGAAAVLALYSRLNDEIRRQIEAKLAEHYPGLNVSIRSAELVEGKGIRLRDLSISERGAEGPNAEVLYVEELLLTCSTDWKDLVQGDPKVQRVTVRRPRLRATHRPDGSWSVAKLLPLPQLKNRPPDVAIDNGIIEIFDPLKTPAGSMTLRDVNFTLIPSASPLLPGAGPGVRAGSSGQKSVISNPQSLIPNPSTISYVRQLKGMFSGDGFRRVEVEGSVDPHAATFSIRGQAEAIDFSPELRDSLPGSLTAKIPTLELRGQGDMRFEVSHDPAAAEPWKFDLIGRLSRGRIDDARLPQPLTEIRAAIHLNNEGFSIDDLSARSGQGTLRMTCRRSGFESNSPLSLTAEVRRLTLDRALNNVLPSVVQDQWYKFCPAGEIDADAKLSFDGKTWQPEVLVNCLNVSFTHHKFPYRLEYGKGNIDLKNDHLRLNLTAYSGSQPVRLEADIDQPFSGPTGRFTAKGDEIQVDEALLAALPQKPSEVARSLNPQGAVSFDLRMWRDKPNEPMHQHLQLVANHCSIRYEKFPYPINDIRGKLEMLDGVWTFQNIEGSNDRAKIACKGSLMPGLHGNELVLKIEGRDVALKEDLRNALTLSPHIQQVWRDMQPRGTVDLSAEVSYLSEQKKFNVGVHIEPQPQSASIEPVHFPYRLDRLEGVLDYSDGQLTFGRCKGEHGAVKILTEGTCNFQNDGRWSVHFAKLSADRLRTDDRELIQALPEQLRKAVADLNPSGTINLRGSLDLERPGRQDEPLHSRWNVRLGMLQSNLQLGGIPVQNVHGEVLLTGGFDGRQLQSRGELMFDSLSYKDCQLTQVLGPVWIDNNVVLFGSWVDRPDNGVVPTGLAGPRQAPRMLTANFCGGKYFADGWVTREPEPRYMVKATLTNAELALCAREMGAGQPNMSGKIIATADLLGTGHTRNTLSGKGNVRLSSGNVYDLPLMVALVQFLGIQPPSQNAFSDAAIDYHIEGEHIYLDNIEFYGDTVSLRGKGQMNFQSQIDLTFHAMVGRGELDLPVIKQLLSGASQQIMQIYVTGNLQNPQVRKEALPGVNHVLQELTGEPPSRR
jgi:hypothetical protein